ncbi:ribosome hibernation-promoting factor, HPF/YfiA family [Nocardioides yefusunii]|uniref:Ribosome hibernation promoting factor n=1 Tax=Nocardioides yefusunii TaxID=2500546 RepID=A0ABW1QY36_9ACTN|nr:ribosome-associated translation inhibitor RaiA [Nocardioides yefusunii]
MDVVVTGRQIEISDRYREHVADKLARLVKHDGRIQRIACEVSLEKNPRLAEQAVRVELTAYTKGPIVRAEAAAEDKMAALDLSLDKMVTQFRKASDRRRVHHGRRAPVSVGEALSAMETPAEEEFEDVVPERKEGSITVTGDGPLVVREKEHVAAPMTLDTALYEMELVGHDFYLFVDKESGKPSVVYRRRGYDYGVIALDVAT